VLDQPGGTAVARALATAETVLTSELACIECAIPE
jgi:hypothetical protein